ncbi:MAG: Hsp70 family protein [Mycoplasmoidaceae bacterium]
MANVEKDEIVLGIDLGTTNSCVAVVIDKEPQIIVNEQGKRTIPSIVVIEGDDIIVGDEAKEYLLQENKNVIYSVKRLMGSKEKIKIDEKEFTPEEISAKILSYIKNRAELALNKRINKVVITVPAYFDDGQRQATKNAGRIAGLEVLRIINEPTAAALAYGTERDGSELNILVYDLGGGTFDVTVLHMKEGIYTVLSTSGDNHLGGDDWDNTIAKWIDSEINRIYKMDIDENDKNISNKLKSYSEFVKIQLSSMDQLDLDVSVFTGIQGSSLHITKNQFLEMTKPLMERTMAPVTDAITESGLTNEQIDKVVLVGGSTKMPMVREYLTTTFGAQLDSDVNPDEVVALGAAIQGAILKGEIDAELKDVIPLSLGMETYDGTIYNIIKRNTNIPVTVSDVFATTYDNQTAIDINVFQGERPMAVDNKLLGGFEFLVDPAPKGTTEVEVSYYVDMDGILNVSSKNLKTGVIKSAVIKDTSGLDSSEINKMIKEAEKYKSLDLQKVKDNQLVQIIWDYLNILIAYVQDNEKNIPPFFNRQKSIDWIERVSVWIEKNEVEEIKANIFAFQLHVNTSLHNEIKKGAKIGFKISS